MGITEGMTAGWTFQVDEVSAGVYRVCGVDPLGRTVEAEGTDPDALLKQCKEAAAKMNRSSNA